MNDGRTVDQRWINGGSTVDQRWIALVVAHVQDYFIFKIKVAEVQERSADGGTVTTTERIDVFFNTCVRRN